MPSNCAGFPARELPGACAVSAGWMLWEDPKLDFSNPQVGFTWDRFTLRLWGISRQSNVTGITPMECR